MKILHIGDVAGAPQKIAQTQRKLGYKSDTLSFRKHLFGYEADFTVPLQKNIC
jgi:hypothetical protein